MSAFDRHPRRKAYEKMAQASAYCDPMGQLIKFSPQNRRVRFAVDSQLAMRVVDPVPLTRQIRRSRRAA